MSAAELIVDSFAGGGGASTGITAALGHSPDYAINHDAEALAVHAVNHPETEHLSRNIWKVDPLDVVGRRPVGLAWFSPDCKHFSKAKGGRPVKRSIRDLAWVVVLWAKRVRPRVIILENVEEFRDWGPLVERTPGAGDWVPCPERRGQTFQHWTAELRRLGYKVEWRELRACDFGAPTIRKRFFLIARRDGQPIVWPQPTHGAPTDADVIAGRKRPWRTAADIIDWSLPCPSIFMTKDEAAAYTAATGIRVNRPLAEKTMARIAKGVQRYVLEAAQPFIVPVTHVGDLGSHSAAEPVRTITTAHRGEHAVVAPFLVPRYGERPGQEPRTLSVTEPAATIVPTANGGGLVAAHMMKFRGDSGGIALDRPAPTVTANGFIARPGGAPPLGIATAFLAQHNTGVVGHAAEEPMSTIVQKGCTQAVVSAGLVNMRGSERRMAPTDRPAATVTAGGLHQAEVRAFLVKYYGVDQDPRIEEPLHTATTKPRFGLVMVEGEPFEIVDIGMRMLTPRELFRAQGFPDDYEIERGVLPDGAAIPITKTAAIRLCGNSVCPPIAEALVSANCADLAANSLSEVAA
ncbi:DNA cytosine methyltransferase [Acuticoccus sp. M5D2P5]|uniref:DNA cytosine methyltransferase n=1 Tax=Acuticoccus kalidii TaxID=2910977 RepID=UPI001F2C7BD4|nr:DNA cytosine methyltransferase [Acuticoccus kalidii]MCF3935039.1 DNA cytosine methyltransferase [Acuticoccus kalidii]